MSSGFPSGFRGYSLDRQSHAPPFAYPFSPRWNRLEPAHPPSAGDQDMVSISMPIFFISPPDVTEPDRQERCNCDKIQLTRDPSTTCAACQLYPDLDFRDRVEEDHLVLRAYCLHLVVPEYRITAFSR